MHALFKQDGVVANIKKRWRRSVTDGTENEDEESPLITGTGSQV